MKTKLLLTPVSEGEIFLFEWGVFSYKRTMDVLREARLIWSVSIVKIY